jgi:hypothetical protein
MKNTFLCFAGMLFCLLTNAKTYLVGAGRTYTKPSQIMSLVGDGDTVRIDAGLYSGDVGIWNNNNLVIKGVGGYAHLDANGLNYGGKAIWVVNGNNTYIENIEFSGATVPDQNGAGIRQQGINLTINHCYFHDNEDGILAGDNATSNIIVEYSEFARNGYGDGYSHNIYINHVNSFTAKYSYFHHAKIGHNLKSRAYNNNILYNRIMDEETGTSSYLIDLPNGGYSLVIGNLLMKGPQAQNQRLIEFGAEGLSNPVNKLYVVNNTMVNKRSISVFVFVQSGTTEAKIINNIFAGSGTKLSGTADTLTNMYIPNVTNVKFKDTVNYDYHLLAGSPAIDFGSDPGTVNGFSLTPIAEYVHPTDSAARQIVNKIDAGAYEFDEGSGIQQITDNEQRITKIYPNPINQFSVISFQLTVKEAVTLMLYDMNGRCVRTITNNGQNSEIPIERGDLQSGTYFYELINQSKEVFGRGKIMVM